MHKKREVGSVEVKPWDIDWFVCTADADDVKYAKENNKELKIGDELWRTANGFGPFFPDHNHWAGSYLSGEKDEILVAAAAPVMLDALKKVVDTKNGLTSDQLLDVVEKAIKCAETGEWT